MRGVRHLAESELMEKERKRIRAASLRPLGPDASYRGFFAADFRRVAVFFGGVSPMAPPEVPDRMSRACAMIRVYIAPASPPFAGRSTARRPGHLWTGCRQSRPHSRR